MLSGRSSCRRVRSKLYDLVMDSAALDVAVSSTVAVVDFDGSALQSAIPMMIVLMCRTT